MMKNTILKITLILSVIGGILVSCESDYQIKFVNLGLEYVLSDKSTSITSLDNSQTIKFNILSKEGSSLTAKSMEIYQKVDDNFNKLADATISGKEATFNSSVFDVKYLKSGKSIALQTRLITSLGDIVKRNISIDVTKPTKAAKKLSKITYSTSIEDTLWVSAKTNQVKIDSYKLYWKKNKAGTYVEETKTFYVNEKDKAKNTDTEKNYFFLIKEFENTTAPYNLDIKDTLNYRFITKSGQLSDTLDISLPIVSQMFKDSNSTTIYKDLLKNKLSLDTNKIYPDTETEKAEIKFLSPSGLKIIESAAIEGFVSIDPTSNTSVYYNTAEKYFKEKDLLKIKEDYDAGTPSTTISTVERDKVYVYKVTRSVKGDNPSTKTVKETKYDVIKYGVIQIDITSVNGDVTSFDINHGEGMVN